jgi:hypothetical protein
MTAAIVPLATDSDDLLRRVLQAPIKSVIGKSRNHQSSWFIVQGLGVQSA